MNYRGEGPRKKGERGDTKRIKNLLALGGSPRTVGAAREFASASLLGLPAEARISLVE
jgi:hypothetical protein